jgi:hypothetical protein
MGGDTQKVTNTSQNTAQSGTQTGQTTPYAPTQDYINQLLSNLGGTSANLTPTESGALGNLSALGAQGDPFAGDISNVARYQLTGGPDRSGVINDAYGQYQSLLTPFAQGNYVNPESNPELQKYLDVARSDASNSVRSQFAGAGRDMSGYEQQAESRGIGQAEAPILYDAYNQGRNQQLSSISGLLSGGLSASQGLSANDAQRAALMNSGVANAGAYNASNAYGPLLQLQAAAQARGIPLQTLAAQFGLTLPAAQAFGTTSGSSSATGTGTGTSTETTQVPLFDKLLSAGALGGALYGKSSDIRLKTNVRRVGELDNGLPVYSYRYKAGGPHEIGLMAQDVEKVRPWAVGERNGFKTVDYAAAVN